mmetsp:Transcript_51138/g.119864  ORF Transcript_51138/g.119864 Transcript_51138/m.119864 type:complete len:239 (+) Transcript_51138:249-965(+)
MTPVTPPPSSSSPFACTCKADISWRGSLDRVRFFGCCEWVLITRFLPEWWITGASPAAGNLDCEAFCIKDWLSSRTCLTTVAAIWAKTSINWVSMSLRRFSVLNGGTISMSLKPKHLISSSGSSKLLQESISLPMLIIAFTGWRPKPTTVFNGSGQSRSVVPKLKSKRVHFWPINLTQHFCRPQSTSMPWEPTDIEGHLFSSQPAFQSVKPRMRMSTAISTESMTVLATKDTWSAAAS